MIWKYSIRVEKVPRMFFEDEQISQYIIMGSGERYLSPETSTKDEMITRVRKGKWKTQFGFVDKISIQGHPGLILYKSWVNPG
jgi:glutathione peroxidase-family protein